MYNQRNNTTTLKFNGKMDVKEANTASLSKLNLETFLWAVEDIVEKFGLETYFYLPDSSGVMKYLSEDHHTFTLPLVLDKHKFCLIEPAQVLDSAGDETAASIVARFKCDDDYEMCDFSISSCH